MARVTFARDYSHPIDALTSVTYRGGNSYTVTPEVELAARAAGALKEKARGSRARAKKGGIDAPESGPGGDGGDPCSATLSEGSGEPD
ncbi:hypothetical protein [Sphingomonas soli]|uniref:hypothetical protein n=1 Tax=Sphingomonas soli TaxID=266127 RepID=UPI000B2433FF|nr:hypothetical protein [Sphingomonas soli]